ncbi:FlgO family outer membrane protein [Echinimonas agarilytica]|uniref:FlgO family outer membrane protein n=1 Tax=Echinimonas agarilytica TaxID=1215918 RepID=A0AA42B7U3_9GAMM|nr:FlgO family outer membrane protein [Echinimonas agarilytica]MCM2680079.1 FlgO family outer membrane protein [Echinimonas agarilytica]
MTTIRIFMVSCLFAALAGCAAKAPVPKEPAFNAVAQTTPMTSVVEDMARQLFITKHYVTNETPIAVTSFVDLTTLQTTNLLGNQMAESFVHHLQANGLRVIEYKSPGYIKVTPEGDFALSRDYRDLTDKLEIDYILTGTYSQQPEGLLVNAKLFAAKSRIVVATAQGVVPSVAYAQEPPRKTSHQKLKLQHGQLVRSSVDESSEDAQ